MQGWNETDELSENEKSGMRPDPVTELGSCTIHSDRGNIQCLTVVGQIEGHQILPADTKTTKYEHLLPLIATVEESIETDGLLILLNTVGGDTEAGLAMAELIAGMKKPTVSLVLGGGHSIGVPLAVAAKRSMIAPSAAMTLHPVRLNGMVIGAPQTYRYLSKIQQRICRFISIHSHISEEKLQELMMVTGEMAGDVGTILYGSEAVELGLIDQLGTLGDALEYLHSEMNKK